MYVYINMTRYFILYFVHRLAANLRNQISMEAAQRMMSMRENQEFYDAEVMELMYSISILQVYSI